MSTIEKDSVSIRFYYDTDENGAEETECLIKILPEVELVKVEEEEKYTPEGFIGHVTRYHKDPFDKEVGRKRAIQKALSTAGLSKADRETIWLAYRDQKPGGRW